MQLAPGPLPQLSTSWYDTTIYDPGLTATMLDALQDLPGLEVVMDALLDPTAFILDALPDDGGGDLLDGASGVITDLASYDPTSDIATIDGAESASADSLLDVFSAIPAEAFEPVPGPATYLNTAPGTTPTLGLTVVFGGVSPPQVPSFTAGTSATLVIQAPTPPGGVGVYSGVDIQMARFKNLVSFDQLDLGATDAQGFIHYQMSFGPDDVGAWKAGIFGVTADGVQLEPPGGDVYWNVLPAAGGGTGAPTGPTVLTSPLATAPPLTLPHEAPPVVTLPAPTPTPLTVHAPPAPLVTVTLVNNTRPGAKDFLITEAWTLVVQGPPLENVIIGGTGPAGPLFPVILGQTDQKGNFTLSGFMGQDNIGSWNETYLVGSTPFIGSIKFTVYA
jgi:hypothetical protein